MLFFIAVVVFWAFWNFQIAPLSDEVSVFSQSLKCEDEKYKTNCVYENNSYTTYKVNIGTGRVLFWDSESTWPILEHRNCNIRDRKNWSCRDNNYNYFGFDDGEYIGDEDKYPKLRYVSKTEFWLNQFFGPMETKVSMEAFNQAIDSRSQEHTK